MHDTNKYIEPFDRFYGVCDYLLALLFTNMSPFTFFESIYKINTMEKKYIFLY